LACYPPGLGALVAAGYLREPDRALVRVSARAPENPSAPMGLRRAGDRLAGAADMNGLPVTPTRPSAILGWASLRAVIAA
jgi:hypothetical protein